MSDVKETRIQPRTTDQMLDEFRTSAFPERRQFAADYDALRQRLAAADEHAISAIRERNLLAKRLVAAEGLLREIRNRRVGPAGYDSQPWTEIRAAIDAHLAGAGEAPTDAELLDYGYAPGNYLSTCIVCNRTMDGVDKRCHVCRYCAVARWEIRTAASAAGAGGEA